MKRLCAHWIFCCVFLISGFSAGASSRFVDGKFSFTVDRVPVRQVVMTFYDECERSDLVFEPNLDALKERLSVKASLVECAAFKKILQKLLRRVGLVIEEGKSFDVVAELPEKETTEGWKEFVYSPRFRDPLELAGMLRSFIKEGRFAHERQRGLVQVSSSHDGDVPETGTNGASLTSKAADRLVFFGPQDEIKLLKGLLRRLDVVAPQIEISAGIYEFQAGPKETSAVQAALNLFSGKFNLNLGQDASSGTVLKVTLPSIEAALSLLDTDSRFNYVAQPKVLTKNAEQVVFTAGQDVRVNDSITTNGSGQSMQSKMTLTAGVTLRATPYIRDDVVELLLHQRVSNFVSSPNDDPSVMRRELNTRLIVEPGQTYVIGGLKINRRTDSQRTFFGLPVSSSSDRKNTEVLLLLTVRQETFN